MNFTRFDFMEVQGKILVTVDSVLESLAANGNETGFDLVRYFLNEYQLHRDGINLNGESTYKRVPIK